MNVKLCGKALRPRLVIGAVVLARACNCLPDALARGIGTAQGPRVQARDTESVRHRAGNPPEASRREKLDIAYEILFGPNQVRTKVARADLRHVRECQTGR